MRQHQKQYCQKKVIAELENKFDDKINDLKKTINNDAISKLAKNQLELQKTIEEKDKMLQEAHNEVKKILIEGTQALKKNNDKIYDMSMKNQNSCPKGKFILEPLKIILVKPKLFVGLPV